MQNPAKLRRDFRDCVNFVWLTSECRSYFRADLERDLGFIGRVAKSMPHAVNKE